MKNILLISALLLGVSTLQAQVYLTDVLKPTEQNRYTFSDSKATKSYSFPDEHGCMLTISHIYQSNGGFGLAGAAHGLIGKDDHGFATFQLAKKYAKMTFWLGPTYYAGGPKDKDVLTITADGRRVLDQKVFNYDAPRFITIDVTDVEEVTFKVLIGEIDLSLAQVQLWKADVEPVQPRLPVSYPQGTLKLVEQLLPYYTNGAIEPIMEKTKAPNGLSVEFPSTTESIDMARQKFKNGLQFTSSEQLLGKPYAYTYFWLGKRYDKLSFIVGPRDNQSSNTSAWLVIYGDKRKILYEGIVRQSDLPRYVVVDVSGQDQVGFSCELRSNDFLGSITFGCVDICAHPKGDGSVPQEGPANINKEKVAKLKSPCALMSNILPYSVRGVAKAKSTMFTGESSYITFYMGGEHFSEGIILTTGTTLFDDKIDAYATFDLAGEFDYISFYAGTLTQHRVLDDDRIQVYADDKLILDTMVHCTWPNMYFELPLNKCRCLRFAKPGNSKRKQTYIGLGDIALYRGKPVAHDLFYHDKPECPYEADLIDLCERPYFHFVGRYLSTLTNFDFNDCFKPGGSQREFFQMKDGSKIYKGVMLEANVPLSFEDISISDAVMMFLVGAGGSIGKNDVTAATGVSAGGGLTGQWAITRLMNNQNGGQASVAAFNPYGEYETCTFSIANKSEYWDDMSLVKNFGKQIDHPFKLYVFADQVLVKELELTNKMEPMTVTVPINQCHQLMFWLEPGQYRSGQYVLYDMKVSKAPYIAPAEEAKPAEATKKEAAPQEAASEEVYYEVQEVNLNSFQTGGKVEVYQP
jgi:hypothetical protein